MHEPNPLQSQNLKVVASGKVEQKGMATRGDEEGLGLGIESILPSWWWSFGCVFISRLKKVTCKWISVRLQQI